MGVQQLALPMLLDGTGQIISTLLLFPQLKYRDDQNEGENYIN